MKRNLYYIVDVFGKKKYSGNQLAVVLMTKNISDKEMQLIAREFNFSETTFVLPYNKKDKHFSIRIFTPQSEIPFAGHPTLGTAYIINNIILGKPKPSIKLNLKIGEIPIFFKQDGNRQILWMQQTQPTFGKIHKPKHIAKILGLKTKDIDTEFPIQEVSTGLPFIMIPLKNLDAVKQAQSNEYLQLTYFNDYNIPLFLFSSDTYEKNNDINCRMFAHALGISEDAATGSANGCLAAYLCEHEYFDKDLIDLKVEQGYEMGRESILYLHGEKTKKGFDIFVGGEVFLIANGELI